MIFVSIGFYIVTAIDLDVFCVYFIYIAHNYVNLHVCSEKL